jgi:hypothetical protein
MVRLCQICVFEWQSIMVCYGLLVTGVTVSVCYYCLLCSCFKYENACVGGSIPPLGAMRIKESRWESLLVPSGIFLWNFIAVTGGRGSSHKIRTDPIVSYKQMLLIQVNSSPKFKSTDEIPYLNKRRDVYMT